MFHKLFWQILKYCAYSYLLPPQFLEEPFSFADFCGHENAINRILQRFYLICCQKPIYLQIFCPRKAVNHVQVGLHRISSLLWAKNLQTNWLLATNQVKSFYYPINCIFNINFNNYFWNSKGKSSGIGGTGKPLDELDQTCKTLSTCHSCIQLQHGEETCDPVTQKYKARLKKNDESGKVEIQCLNTMNKVNLLIFS